MTIEFKDTLNTVLKDDDLDIYEKMCLLILLNMEEDSKLTSEVLGNYMGCSTVRAKLAFESLNQKGYLKGESAYYEGEFIQRRESNIISPNREVIEVGDIREALKVETEEFLEGFFKPLYDENQSTGADDFQSMAKSNLNKVPPSKIDEETERRQRLAAYLMGSDEFVASELKPFVSVKETKQSLVDQVISLIEEKISFKEANIILGFASNDLELIKRKYKIAKLSQMSDTISVLINELQKKDSAVIKAEEVEMERSQINTNRIMKMQAYKNQQK
ncbi:hypothetical protein [Fusibacter sp. 3D3]|uniref:hypothetical protein n=1 Tax=Fusibacter sp. 3D3 TaxID=1048380 RepID=UPI0008534BAC|nr:hypothetical protein [Fusibacter sp. 3D3]GAU76358.1 hypothetical protein F3D3_0955 [Fusibacter sp. 3D3]